MNTADETIDQIADRMHATHDQHQFVTGIATKKGIRAVRYHDSLSLPWAVTLMTVFMGAIFTALSVLSLTGRTRITIGPIDATGLTIPGIAVAVACAGGTIAAAVCHWLITRARRKWITIADEETLTVPVAVGAAQGLIHDALPRLRTADAPAAAIARVEAFIDDDGSVTGHMRALNAARRNGATDEDIAASEDYRAILRAAAETETYLLAL